MAASNAGSNDQTIFADVRLRMTSVVEQAVAFTGMRRVLPCRGNMVESLPMDRELAGQHNEELECTVDHPWLVGVRWRSFVP